MLAISCVISLPEVTLFDSSQQEFGIVTLSPHCCVASRGCSATAARLRAFLDRLRSPSLLGLALRQGQLRTLTAFTASMFALVVRSRHPSPSVLSILSECSTQCPACSLRVSCNSHCITTLRTARTGFPLSALRFSFSMFALLLVVVGRPQPLS